MGNPNGFSPRLMRCGKALALLTSHFALTIKNGSRGGNQAAISCIAPRFSNRFGAHHILDHGGWMTRSEQAINDTKGRNARREARLVAGEASGRVEIFRV